MSELSSERILKAQATLGNQYFLREVRKEILSNQQKMARDIYNVENRNIKKFAQEWQSFKRKFGAGKEGGTAKVQSNKNDGRRYEDNQRLELTYGLKFRQRLSEANPLGRQDSAVTIRNQTTQGNSNSSRNVVFKNRLNNKLSFRVNYVELSKSREKLFGVRQKSNSMIKEERNSLRKRIATQWDLSPVHDNMSRISAKGMSPTNSTPQYHTEDYIIDITRDKIDRFIRTMHRLDWSFTFFKENPGLLEDSKEYRNHMKRFQYDPDTPINQQAINYMISRRYELLSNYLEDIYEKRYRELTEDTTSLDRKKLSEESQYPLLSSLSRQSILGLLHKNLESKKGIDKITYEENRKEVQLYFSLPFSQFISYRQTKNSIYQLVGMGAKMGLRMAFSIFDKNRNGLIDEFDLIQLISLSRKIPKLQIDISIISRAMLVKQTKKLFFQRSKLQLKVETVESRMKESRERSLTYGNLSQEPSQIMPIQEEENSQFEENEESQRDGLSTSRFSLDKLYTFLKNKERNKQKDTSRFGKGTVQPLNFLMFCKAYEFKRPFVLYDLFQFIFGTTIEDYKEPIRVEINAHLMKLQHSVFAMNERSEEETLQEKWNKRLKNSNAILESFVREKDRL